MSGDRAAARRLVDRLVEELLRGVPEETVRDELRTYSTDVLKAAVETLVVRQAEQLVRIGPRAGDLLRARRFEGGAL